jgi:hypothetical protein
MISAKIIADSISPSGVRLTTFELEYPRFILAELNTHRMLSKNSASSRAIPVERTNAMIKETPAMPVHWGKNQAGMQANTELEGLALEGVKGVWLAARDEALRNSKILQDIGLHKQITNRITEPWQTMKTVVTGTEWSNLLWLRNHDAAQPEFHELAKLVQEAFDSNLPDKLKVGQWHLPYVDDLDIPLELQIKLSVSLCAQVSYRKSDTSIQKALDLYDRLVGSDRLHASPLEHQGTPIPVIDGIWPDGVTHQDRRGQYWSGNLRGFIQYRKMLPNENH